jgi:hypothetical protein
LNAARAKKTTRRKSRAKARKDWQAPDSPPPESWRIDAYLLDAREQIAESDIKGRPRQLEARRALAALYRTQLIEQERLIREANEAAWPRDAQVSEYAAYGIKRQHKLRQAAQVVDPRLKLFFDELSLLIWRSGDPLATVQALLYGEPARGAPRKYEYRNFLMATKVADRMLRGEKRDAACKSVADEFGLSSDAVLNIYKTRNKPETTIQLGMFGLPGKGAPVSAPDELSSGPINRGSV